MPSIQVHVIATLIAMCSALYIDIYRGFTSSVGQYHFYLWYMVLQTQNGIRHSTVFDQAGR